MSAFVFACKFFLAMLASGMVKLQISLIIKFIISNDKCGPLADNNWWQAISNLLRPPKSGYWYSIQTLLVEPKPYRCFSSEKHSSRI